MLNLTNVSKTYPKSSAKAVDSLNLDVKDGYIQSFIKRQDLKSNCF